MNSKQKFPVALVLCLGLLPSSCRALNVVRSAQTLRNRFRNYQDVKLPDFVVTSIDVQDVAGETDRVYFHGRLPGMAPGQQACVLTDIVDTGEKEQGQNIYRGTRVDINQFQWEVNKRIPNRAQNNNDASTLLCMHGFNTQPQDFFKRLHDRDVYNREGFPAIIAVLWATSFEGGLREMYRNDSDNADEAGRNFGNLLEAVAPLTRKSLMCHSMSNYILKWVADPNAPKTLSGLTDRFEHIFMVAADTVDDLFSQEGTPAVGLAIANLARKKVHIVHHRGDWVLPNRFRPGPALGIKGAKLPLDPEVAEKVEQHDVTNERNQDWLNHGYHLDEAMLKRYQSILNEP